MLLLRLRFRFIAILAGVSLLGACASAQIDPPSRVARLAYTAGVVNFSAAGDANWVPATVNRPVANGDRLWTDGQARAEIQLGGAAVRLNAQTAASVLDLDDQIAQLQLSQGTLNLRVRQMERDQVFEVDTPNLVFLVRQPGEYRVTVDPDGQVTTIIVRNGQAEARGVGGSFLIDTRQTYRFVGADLRRYQLIDTPWLDEFDRWAMDRDRMLDNSVSARYVPADVVGYQDLDANGTWQVDATYGNVWYPNRVTVGWAPYRNGHWAMVNPWGWTWVDDAPWGFAVSHYGRWAQLGGRWAWVPGPNHVRAVYAPALVAFVVGNNFQLSISSGIASGAAWFPLGPRDVYRPDYRVSRGYPEHYNRNNSAGYPPAIEPRYDNRHVPRPEFPNGQLPRGVVPVQPPLVGRPQGMPPTPDRMPQAGQGQFEPGVFGSGRRFERPVPARPYPRDREANPLPGVAPSMPAPVAQPHSRPEPAQQPVMPSQRIVPPLPQAPIAAPVQQQPPRQAEPQFPVRQPGGEPRAQPPHPAASQPGSMRGDREQRRRDEDNRRPHG